MSLQCRLTDRLAIIALDAKANTILRHTARKKLDDGSIFIRRDKLTMILACDLPSRL